MKMLKQRLRWYLKKTARYGVVLLSWGSGWLYLRNRLAREPRVRALMYHRFRDCPFDPFSVSLSAFTQQMEWLAKQKLAVSLSDFQEFLSGRKALQNGSVLVTIDDGYHDTWSKALPVFQRWGIPAVAFVPAGEISSSPSGSDAETSSLREDEAKLNWTEVVALPSLGTEIGSHAWNHTSLGRLDRDRIHFEVQQSRLELEAGIGAPVRAFAYPFGTQADFNEITAEALRQAGYSCAFTAQHGAIRRGNDVYTLPRIKVEGGEGLWMFKLLSKGGLDGWALVDRAFWWLQASK